MKINEAIILAGGAGTRLRSITKGGQKVSVDIGNKKFIQILLERLEKFNFTKVHLALGYRAKEVEAAISGLELKIDINTVYEDTPLGTGGALKNALKHVSIDNVLVLNGDTFNDVDYNTIFKAHEISDADISILTKYIDENMRYGEVETDNNKNITKFIKNNISSRQSLINVGVYVIKSDIFRHYNEDIFSFEEFLSRNVKTINMKAIQSSEDFIDIGIPEDYYDFLERYQEYYVNK